MPYRFRAAFAVLATWLPLSVYGAATNLEKTSGTGLPKVPTKSTILKEGKEGDDDSKKINAWIKVFVEGKEKKALLELEEIRKGLQKEETDRATVQKERKRREDQYNASWGTLGSSAREDAETSVQRIKLELQLPEIESYRYIAETYTFHQRIVTDLAEALSRLDRDGDGKLAADEYRDAAALTNSTSRMFQKMDRSSDGMISEGEVESMRSIPQNSTVAIRIGRENLSALGTEFVRIKTFDVDTNGELTVDERKALSMSYVEMSLRAGQNAAFYNNIADNLMMSRESLAAKFSHIEIGP